MRDTRADILLEAETLIRRRGYSGFSYADLADVIGIRKASIHHHFQTKADLAVALLARYDATYTQAMNDICESSNDGLECIRAYAALYLGGVEKGLGCLCAAFSAELDSLPERLRADLTAFFGKHIAWIDAVLTAGKANGTIRGTIAPAPYSRMIVAALEGALMIERAVDGPIGFNGAFSAIEDALKP